MISEGLTNGTAGTAPGFALEMAARNNRLAMKPRELIRFMGNTGIPSLKKFLIDEGVSLSSNLNASGRARFERCLETSHGSFEVSQNDQDGNFLLHRCAEVAWPSER